MSSISSSSSSSSSTSSTLPAPGLDAEGIKKKKAVYLGLISSAVLTKTDYHGTAIGGCGMQQNQYRSTSSSFLQCDDKAVISKASSSSANTVKIAAKMAFLRMSSKVHRAALAYWSNLQEFAKDGQISSLQLDVIEGLQKELLEILNRPVTMDIQAQGYKLPLIAVLEKGVPGSDLQLRYNCTLPTVPPLNNRNEFIVRQIAYYTQQSFHVFAFEGDREYEYVIDQVGNLPKNPSSPDEVIFVLKLRKSTMKLFDAAVSHQKLTKVLNSVKEEEKKAVSNVSAWLKEYINLDKALKALPTQSAPAVPEPAFSPSYTSTMAVQRPKRGKVQKPQADSTHETPDLVKPVKPKVQPPKVTIEDQAAYSTYLTLVHVENNKVTWDEVVHCLRVIGFEIIEPTAGGNTWRFKYQNASWLRDRLTYEELAEEFHPEEAGTSQRAFHYPHQGGLSGHSPLDRGRLNSFRKLLDDCLFDNNSVTLKSVNQ